MPRELIGVIPAAGRASRLGLLPCSKEILPVGFHSSGEGDGPRCKVVSQYLLESMRKGNITKAFIVLRDGKWDIPSYLGDGRMVDIHLAYLLVDNSFGVPFTVDAAYPFLASADVALGFPDILFTPANAYAALIEWLRTTGGDLVLGLFPASRPRKMDMVDVDAFGGIRGIEIKPSRTDLSFTWIVAVWTPTFTHYMHQHLAGVKTRYGARGGEPPLDGGGELFMSEVIVAAMNEGLSVGSVTFPEGRCLDIGSPEDLAHVVRSEGDPLMGL